MFLQNEDGTTQGSAAEHLTAEEEAAENGVAEGDAAESDAVFIADK